MKNLKSKEVLFGDASRQRLLAGINTLSNAVSCTLGASGRTVMMTDEYGRPSVTKDGVSVARSIELADPIADMGSKIIRESAEKTVSACGDGTTSTIVLAQYLINEGVKQIAERKLKPFEFKNGIETATKEVVEKLTNNSQVVTDEKLINVATISANNDEELGLIIAEAFITVGGNGVVTVEVSQTGETYASTVEGLEVERGFDNRYYITDEKKEAVILENPYVLLVDSKINKTSDLHLFLEACKRENRPLFIVGDMDEDVLAMLLLNKVKGGMKICSIKPPSFGYKRKDYMADLAIATGATLIDDNTGDNFQNFDLKFLGNADKILVDKATTTIITDSEYNADIQTHLDVLSSNWENAEEVEDRDFIHTRMAKLAGKVAIVHVGGKTEIEIKERLDRVDDAVNATKSSLEQGVSAGGGVALYDISSDSLVENREQYSESFKAGIDLLKASLKEPMTKIVTNAGLEILDITTAIDATGINGYGYDVKADVYGDMMDMGIVDPTKVLKHSLMNAVSVAMTILTTDCTVTYNQE